MAKAGSPNLSRSEVMDRALTLAEFLRHEFSFRDSFEALFDSTIGAFVQEGLLARSGDNFVAESKDGLLREALILRSLLESYLVAARAARDLVRGPSKSKDLEKRALGMGEKMYLTNEIHFPEALLRPVIAQAFETFVSLGYFVRTEGKLGLSPSFATADTATLLEKRIASLL
jgi:glycerol-3-phosphate O-acyltransferase